MWRLEPDSGAARRAKPVRQVQGAKSTRNDQGDNATSVSSERSSDLDVVSSPLCKLNDLGRSVLPVCSLTSIPYFSQIAFLLQLRVHTTIIVSAARTQHRNMATGLFLGAIVVDTGDWTG